MRGRLTSSAANVASASPEPPDGAGRDGQSFHDGAALLMRRLACLALVALGCSGDSSPPGDAAPDSSADVDAGFVTASHTAMPQVVSLGGSVLATPKMVAISFNVDAMPSSPDPAMQPLIDAFAAS